MQAQNDAPIGRLSATNQEGALPQMDSARLVWRDEICFQWDVSGAAAKSYRLRVEDTL